MMGAAHDSAYEPAVGNEAAEGVPFARRFWRVARVGFYPMAQGHAEA